MSNDLEESIFNSMNLRETTDLLDIWYEHDHRQWTEHAFHAIEQILISRLGEIPPKPEPNEEEHITPISIAAPPFYYLPTKVSSFCNWLIWLAKASIIANILQGIIVFPYYKQAISKYFSNPSPNESIIMALSVITFAIIISIGSAIYYFGLKAISSFLSILMEMEFNSRAVN
jgi:hypothetical protein